MRKRAWLAACLVVALGTVIVAWHDAAAQEPAAKQETKAPAPQIVGSEKCNMCHKMPKYGNQAAVWDASAHHKAFETLAGEEAKKIGTEKGIADPQKAPECLACHTTQAFLGEGIKAEASYSQAEGVGCEACHGPGSEYKSMTIMKDPAKAKEAGLRTPSEETCVKCHNDKSPTFKSFDFKTMWPKIAHPEPKPEAEAK